MFARVLVIPMETKHQLSSIIFNFRSCNKFDIALRDIQMKKEKFSPIFYKKINRSGTFDGVVLKVTPTSAN